MFPFWEKGRSGMKGIIPGQIISHYRIANKLGSGGMGEVYKAEDTKLKRMVALKFLPPVYSNDEESKKRFINEAQSASALDHPNICTIYEVGETEEGLLFISMALYEGKTLKEKIEKGQIEVEGAIDIAQQICRGLEKAHTNGIIHRDIKPANIFITNDGTVKILDFGLAKLSNQTKVTKAGTIVGTVAYMSPEQARGDVLDQRSDIWSLGVTFYEMLTGQLPFRGDYEQALMYAIFNEEPQPLKNLQHDNSIEIERILMKMLKKDAINRYGQVKEVLDELKSFKDIILKGDKKSPVDSKKTSKSIAVLPFRDMSPQKDQDYLCEGFAEELINALTRIEGLKIPSRTSSFLFKGREEDIREIGRSLNVETVLEGSVQKSKNQLRVTVQLINVADGYHLWSERFDRNIKDVFAVQDEISMAVVNKLKVKLLEGEKENVVKRHTLNERAYEFYLKGRYHWNRRSPKDMIKAVDFFQRAIDIDRNYALPYIGIADVFNMLTEFGFIDPRIGYSKSQELLQRALKIDDSLGELYASLALITYCHDWDLVTAENYARRSVELNQSDFNARCCHAEILATMGHYEEAIDEVKKGIELEPLHPLAYSLYGILLGGIGRVEEGRQQLEKSLEMDKDNPMILSWLGMAYFTKPLALEKAIEHLQKAANLGVTLAIGYLGMALAIKGRREEAMRCLWRLEKIEKETFLPFPARLLLYFKPAMRHFRNIKMKYCPSHLKAVIYLGLNMQENALSELEKSARARDYLVPAVLSLIENYDLTGIADVISSSRFQALHGKIKMS
jgi:serine/threonine protein kinase/tetratricopeptide (TPR) repeat protein